MHAITPISRPSERGSLDALPAEILLPILIQSCSPSLIHVCSRLRDMLPPYIRYTQALAAIATCPEGPEHGSLMRGVFDRAMEEFYADCCIAPLTITRKWQIRREVWTSRWFGATQFEAIVLLLYRRFLMETLRLLKPRIGSQLARLREHMLKCRDLRMVVGEEFVAGVKFKGSRVKEGRSRKGGGKQCRGDLLFTFNSISIFLSGKEHRLTFWGTRHLYDLPDGLFGVQRDQLRVIAFLTTLDWHWKSKAILMPGRNEAFGDAVGLAIRECDFHGLEVLLGLWAKIRIAGNEHVLHVYHHLQEGLMTGKPEMLEALCCGFQLPFHARDFLHAQDQAADAAAVDKASKHSGTFRGYATRMF